MKINNYYSIINKIDMIVSGKINKREIFQLIKSSNLEKYFFTQISSIDWFHLLKENGYFNPKRVPGPKPADEEGSFYIPQWNVLPYLEKISKEITKPENERYIDDLLEIIKNVSAYKDEKGNHIDNYRTWWYFVKILSNIPNEKITDDIIELIPVWLDSKFETSLQGAEIINLLLPKFLKEKATADDIRKAEKIIDYITKLKTVSLRKGKEQLYGKREKFKFQIDSYWLEKAFEKYGKQIAERCTIKTIENLVEKIKKMLKSKRDGAYKSFCTDIQIFEPLDLLTKILREILNEKAKLKAEEIKEIISAFLKSDFYYFQKIALYIISQNLKNLKDIVWKHLDKIIGNSVQRNYFAGDELRNLLINLKDLTSEQKEEIKSKVEIGPSEDIPEKDPEKSKLLWRQKIYQALSSDPYFKKLYDDIKKKTKKDTKLTLGIVWMGAEWIKEKAPLNSEEIIKKSNEELAKIFSEFKNTDFWEGPTVDGLSDLLKEIVQKNPEKFFNNLTPFLRSGYLYIYDILWGLKDAWKAKKNIDWESLFVFIEKYIKQEGFWEGKLMVEGSHWNADHEWVLRLIGELVQEGTKDDSWAFDVKLLSQAENILFYVIDEFLKLPPREDREEEDPVTYALNSAKGNIIEALLFLTLRKARVDKAKNKSRKCKWSIETKEKYEKLLESHIGESFTLLGQYLPNFWYLDNKWVKTQINKILYEENKWWLNFFIGYVFGEKVYLDFFKIMIPHYERAMDIDFKSRIAEERFVQHIAIGYLNSIVRLHKSSLMGKMVDKINPEKMDILVRYFRSYLQDHLKAKKSKKRECGEIEEVREKVLDFWRYIYENYKDKQKLSEEEKNIVSPLLMLTIILSKLDEEKFQWILFSLSNMKKFYEGKFLIEDLNILKDKGSQPESGRLVGKILKEILKKTTPTLFKENIKSIVVFLYELGDEKTKNMANDICNKYAERNVVDETTGQLFLRDIYETYNEI